MSIKIHHGPNGSYKTSGAIQDDAVPALKEGRVIITNVRGFTLERAYTVFPDLPNTAEIINLDLESLADLERMRTWFQWAPRGAFLIFDETQLLFPKSWREKDLEKFDFPGGPEAAHEADRPMGWLDAWTRHRHFNWDIVLTTPNISYIRDDIRMTCEMAYRHSNLAVIGPRVATRRPSMTPSSTGHPPMAPSSNTSESESRPSPSTSPPPPARPRTPRPAKACSGRLSWFFYWHCWPVLLAMSSLIGLAASSALSLLRPLPSLCLLLMRPLSKALLWLLRRVLLRLGFFLLVFYLLGQLVRLLT